MAHATPPLAGVLVDHTQDYRWPAYLAAVAAALALAIVLPLRADRPVEQERAARQIKIDA